MAADFSTVPVNLSTGETDPLPTSPDELIARMTACGVVLTVHHHPAVFTVAESQKIDAQIPGAHTRNMFLKDKKGAMFLVTLRHDTPVDLKKLSDVLGAGRFSFGSPERLWDNLGVRPGSVTPLAIVNDTAHAVTLVLEAGMMAEDIVNFHPLVNTMTVGMTPDGLLKFLDSIGVQPRVVDLGAAAP